MRKRWCTWCDKEYKEMTNKPDPKDSNNKAPVGGSNKSSDNKATATGKDVDPNRPKSD